MHIKKSILRKCYFTKVKIKLRKSYYATLKNVVKINRQLQQEIKIKIDLGMSY